jgi:hypothetical protein
MTPSAEPNLRDQVGPWLLPALTGRRLLFVTLTCKRQLSNEQLSSAIRRMIHGVKRKVLGRKGERVELATVTVLEPSFQHGVHAHLILEDPFSVAAGESPRCTTPIAKLIADEWIRLGLGAKAVAQDVQPVYDLPGAIRYLQKTIGGASVQDRLDINNLCLPEGRPAQSNSHVPVSRDNQ